MRRLVLVLAPVALFAQVMVDTVIRFPGDIGRACFFPEFNKLYVDDRSDFGSVTGYFVLDCSTYELRPKVQAQSRLFHYSWNWRRQKLYVTCNPRPESTLVIDVAADSVLGWLEVCREWHSDVYLSDVDRRYKPAVDTLYEYDCASDTVTRRLPVHSTCASWDSVGRKLYVGQGSQKKLYVYDYLKDSCLKVIDVSAISATKPDACVFSRTYRRAYVSSEQYELSYAGVGIVDTERDTLLRVLPVRVNGGWYNQCVVDELDGKVYMVDCDGRPETPDTMWVVDCATDSVLKKFECVEQGHARICIRWVPWSNRIYLINTYPPDTHHNSALVVIDCNTDSVIVPGMLLGDYLYDIQLDPIRQRIFVIGDTNKVYVLRDVEGGVVEEPAARPRPAATARICASQSRSVAVEYSLGTSAHVRATLHDAVGRRVGMLDVGEQKPGTHRLSWGRNGEGPKLSAGAYFVLLDMGTEQSRLKAVVR